VRVRDFEVRRHGPITEFVMGPAPLGRPLLPVRCYLVDGLLIDTGPPSQARDLAHVLREFPVRQVVNTHHHEDHAGNNALITATLGLRPRIHPLGVPLLADVPGMGLYRRVVWGMPPNSAAEPLGDLVETERHRFRVVHTPGHAPDHVVLVEPDEGWTFGGDLYIHDKLKLVRRQEDPLQQLASLERMAAEPVGTLFCAHRGPVADGAAALARKRAHMAETRDAVRALHAAGREPAAIARQLFGPGRLVSLFSAGDFTSLNLVEALLPGWPGPAPPGPR
jgi:glyoxylase-like metal-dependent hydrolase (beta-lactamase superfamily II)